MTTTISQAEALLTALYGGLDVGEYMELRTIDLQGAVRQYFFTSPSALLSAASKLSGVNVYYGLGIRLGRNGKKEHTASVGAAYADVDFKVFPDGEQGATDALARFPLPQSAVIHSGGGLQALWFLREAATPDDFPRLEAVNRGLTIALARRGSDWIAPLMRRGSFAFPIRSILITPLRSEPGWWNCSPKDSTPSRTLRSISR